MKTPRRTPSQTLLAASALLTFCAVSANSSFAAARTWTGLGTDNSTSNSANWGTPPISGTDSLTFTGTTRLTPDLDASFVAVSTQTAGTAAAGAILFGNGTAGSASSFTIGSTNGSVLTLNSGAADPLSTNGIINASGNPQTITTNITVNNTGGSTGATVIGSNNAGGDLTLSGTLTATTPVNFSSNTTNTTTVGTLNGAGAVGIAASIGTSGTTVINTLTGYTGTLSINAGSVILGSDRGTGTTTMASTGPSAIYLKAGTNFAKPITIAPSGATSKILGMAPGSAGNVTFSGNITNSDVDTTKLQLTADAGARVTISGQLDFGRPIEKVGSGTVVLSHPLNFNSTGGLKITQGTLSIATDRNMGALANPVDLAGGTLDTTATVPVSASRTLTVSANSSITLSGAPANHLTWNGSITGPGNIALSATNLSNLILNGNNTGYTGDYFVSSGRLQVGGAAATNSINASNDIALSGTGYLVVTTGGTATIGNLTASGNSTIQPSSAAGTASLVVNQGVDAIVSAYMKDNTGILNFTKNGSAKLTLTSNNTYTGATSINAGTLQVGDGTDFATISASSSIANNGTLIFDVGPGNRTISAVISGNGSLTQAGLGGILTLTNNNTYTGNTTVSAGTLALAGNGTLGNGTLTSSGGVVDLAGKSITNIIGSLTGGGAINNGTITNNGGYYEVQNGTVGAVLSGTNGLSKTTTGVVTLLGVNTYLGNTAVSSGTLRLGNSSATASFLPDSGDLSLASGATLDLNFADSTVQETIRALYLNGVLQAAGTYDSTHASGAITGTGKLLVTTGAITDPYAVWTGSYSLTGNNTLKTADPDGDGLNNLLEYATGTSPISTGASGVSVVPSGGFLTLTYTRIADPALTYTVEFSNDLTGAWQTLVVAGNPSTGVSNVAGNVTITDTAALGSTSKRFLRLKVASN